MAYGEVYIDQIVYSTPTGDVAIDISGITYNFVTLTGSSGTFTSLLSGAVVSGTQGFFDYLQAVSGIFSATGISANTLTGSSITVSTTGIFDRVSGIEINSKSASGIGSISLSSGTEANPSLHVYDDTDTGFASLVNFSVSFVSSGTEVARFDESGLSIRNQEELRFYTSGNSNYVSFKSPQSVGTNVELVVPTGDGASGSVLSIDQNSELYWQQTSGGGASGNYQEFTSNGTWTKPSDCTVVYVECIGGGAGGGSGSRFGTGVSRGGGGGGAGGQYVFRYFPASSISGTVSVTVGAPGSGGPAITVDSTSGSEGSNGGASSFGSYLQTMIAGGGSGGASGSAGGAGRAGSIGDVVNLFVQNGGTASRSICWFGPGGGASGGFYPGTLTLPSLARSGSVGFTVTVSGGFSWGNNGTGPCTGAASPGSPLGGASPHGTSGSGYGGGGGGGVMSGAGTGAGTQRAGTIGGNGGQGAFPGGGGGGGGPSNNGYNSGEGGAGGSGVVRVWAW